MDIKNRIKAEILVDSTNFMGDRAITFLVDIPQIVVKELLRHRMFSFSSSSMRAIPFVKVLEKVRNEMFYPIAFQKAHKGMQGTEYIDSLTPYYQWENAAFEACERAKRLTETGATKQLTSRLLETFGYAKILITATEYENYFSLRCPKYQLKSSGEYTGGGYDVYLESRKDWLRERKIRKHENQILNKIPKTDIEWLETNKSGAEIHIQDLAEKMWDSKNTSKSKKLRGSQWHVPFYDEKYDALLSTGDLLKVSVAKAARLSYTNHDGKIDHKKDIDLFAKLIKDKHWGCSEHQLRAVNKKEYFMYSKSYLCSNVGHLAEDIKLGKTKVETVGTDSWKVTEYGWCKNIRGFISYRHMLENNLM